MIKKCSKAYGFTLIELSIVLVIIGLIVGGVLVGRDLIKSAEVRNQIKQIYDIETQIQTFRGKYDCLPGDCINATSYFGASYGGNSVVNGDGDGLIRATVGISTPYTNNECLQGSGALSETSNLFLQLNAANLGNYKSDGNSNILGTGIPYISLSTGTGLFVTCLTSSVHPGVTPAFLGVSNVVVLGYISVVQPRVGYSVGLYGLSSWGGGGAIGIPVATAQMIDQKMDDGFPDRGAFGIIAVPSPAVTNCSLGAVYPTVTCTVVVGKRM